MKRILFIAALLAVAAGTAPAAADRDSDSPVSVREDHGTYFVAATFVVPQPPAVALAVLTDYDRIPQFMPQIQTSIVLERTDGVTVVEQEAVSRVMAFSRRVHLVLEITDRGDVLHFRDRCGRSFRSYEGTWRVAARDGGTELTYALAAQPSFDVPEFLVKRVMRRDAATTIDQLRREIAARAR